MFLLFMSLFTLSVTCLAEDYKWLKNLEFKLEGSTLSVVDLKSLRHVSDIRMTNRSITIKVDGVYKSVSLENLKLCKTSAGSYEPWTFHVNHDGTYGILGSNVRVLQSDLYLYLSSVCGYVDISGSVKMLRSYLRGGENYLEKLIIAGELEGDSEWPIFFDVVESTSPSSGLISGQVHFFRVKFGGNLVIDSCTNLNKTTEECFETNHHQGYPVTINNSDIVGPLNRIYGFVELYDVKMKGKALLKGKDQFNFLRINLGEFGTESEITKLENLSATNFKVFGKLHASNSTAYLNSWDSVTIEGTSTFEGPHSLFFSNFTGLNEFNCTSICIIQGSQGRRAQFSGSVFNGYYRSYAYLSNRNKINAIGGNVFFGGLETLGTDNTFEDYVSIDGSVQLGSDIKLKGSLSPLELCCSNCNGISISGSSKVYGPNTEINGWLNISGSTLNAGSKIFTTNVTYDGTSNIKGSTFGSTTVNGSIEANNVTISNYSPEEGYLRCYLSGTVSICGTSETPNLCF